MTWFIGIDEAGYGPNLGPFVMTAVACRVPAPLAGNDLWTILRRVVRRQGETKRVTSRILVADSKVVYAPSRGLRALEDAVLSTVLHLDGEPPATLDCLLERFAGDARTEVRGEPWYTGTTPLPLSSTPDTVRTFAARFQKLCCAKEIEWGPLRICMVCPARFNQLVAVRDSKGEVTGRALGEVLPSFDDLTPDGDPVCVLVDKHGGRDHYAALLQDAYPAGMVMIQAEGAELSQYEIFGFGRQARFAFQPRADSAHLCVSLASMISKYLRELLMHEFNAYWQTHVPGLKATAGYPTDATRYWNEIQPAAERLGLATHTVWRCR
jgi:hypothetical protein